MIEHFIFGFLVGAVCGVIEAWNKIVMFILWIVCVVLTVISTVAFGSSVFTSMGWAWWVWILYILTFAFGIYCGREMFERTFDRKKAVI